MSLRYHPECIYREPAHLFFAGRGNLDFKGNKHQNDALNKKKQIALYPKAGMLSGRAPSAQ
jgi:hypothetical protein